MLRLISLFGFVGCLTLLTACGGGSGGTGGANNNAGSPGGSITNKTGTSGDGSWLTLETSDMHVTAYEGESTPFYVSGKATKSFKENRHVLVLDSSGIISPTTSGLGADPFFYQFYFDAAKTLKPGKYTTTLEIRICQDDPGTCAQPFPGSPWHLPLTVDVKDVAASAARITTTPDFVTSLTEDETASRERTFFQLALHADEEISNIPTGGVYATVSDPNKLFGLDGSASRIGPGQTITLDFPLAHPLNPGTYNTTVEVNLCRTSSIPCTDPFPGSPRLFPVKFDVTRSGNSAGRLIVSPMSENIEIYTDEQGTVALTLERTPDLSGNLYAEVTDPAGYFTDESIGVMAGENWYHLNTSTTNRLQTLGPGTYDTVLKLSICRYYPGTSPCSARQPGSPWKIPVHIVVKPRPAATSTRGMTRVLDHS